MTKAKVFLDSSVLIAATLSPTGGSFRLCKESNNGNLDLITNRYVCDEVSEVLLRKYPQMLQHFLKLLEWSKIRIEKNPRVASVRKAAVLIELEDAAVLAGAIGAKANFLASLDRRDFFTEKLRNAHLSLLIVTPQIFFQEYWW